MYITAGKVTLGLSLAAFTLAGGTETNRQRVARYPAGGGKWPAKSEPASKPVPCIEAGSSR